jgi:hypothetical protein
MRQVATAYTGANISITIGNKFIANAFGISWELSQNKRPIYGYNSMYYDSVASGQIIVMGQLYVNYQHPNYLSSLLSSYFQDADMEKIYTVGFGKTNGPDINNKGFVNEYTKRGGVARQDRTFDKSLNSIFESPEMMANLGAIFTSGETISGFKNFKQVKNRGDANDKYRAVGQYDLIDNEGAALAFSGNLGPRERRKSDAIYHRPDQFTNNGSAAEDSIDIVITHGDPGLNDKSSGILSYMPASSIILRGIHFIGEAQQVMADDQPIMETYKFIARSKEALISSGVPDPEPITPTENKAENTKSVDQLIQEADEKLAKTAAVRLAEINAVRAAQDPPLPPLTRLPE